jgi:hypothetical protein
MDPIPGNPGPIFREIGNSKIVGIPGNREREIPGMKHYLKGINKVKVVQLGSLWRILIECQANCQNDNDLIVKISKLFFHAFIFPVTENYCFTKQITV